MVSEQFPKGGALTLNAIAGIGMLTVGIVGSPLIGAMQEKSAQGALEKDMEGVYEKVSEERSYFLGKYNAVVDEKVQDLPKEEADKVGGVVKKAKQGALAKVTVFPLIMLACYIGLIMYFKARGGYKAVRLDTSEETHAATEA